MFLPPFKHVRERERERERERASGEGESFPSREEPAPLRRLFRIEGKACERTTSEPRERLAKAENEAVRGSDGHEGNAIAVAADQGFQIGERQEDGGGVAVGMDAE